MVKIGTLGGLGYLLPLVVYLIDFVSPATMWLETTIAVFIISLVAVIMLVLAWYMLGCRLQDGLMKLHGILHAGWIILAVAMVWIVNIIYVAGAAPLTLIFSILLFLIPVGALFLIIWYKVESGLMKIIVMGLLGLYVISFPILFAVSIVGLFIYTISFISLFVIIIALEIRNLLAAGSKLKERCFGFAGWLKLGVAILLLVALLLIGSTAAIGFTPGTISQVTGMTEAAMWITTGAMVLGIVANIFAAIAFLKAKIPEE